MTSDLGAALRDADVVMALRIQRERMAGGLLPSLREYAARFGLTRDRLALARPDALVMHPGPMNEGVEIAPDVAVGAAVGDHRSGHERRRGPDGAAVPAGRARQARGRRLSRRRRRRPGRRRSICRPRDQPGVAGRPGGGPRGPGRDRGRATAIVEAVTWLDGAEAEGVDDGGRHRRARVHRPPRPPARAGQRGRRDRRDRARGGRPRRVHDRLRDAQHDARRSTSRASSPGSRGRGARPGRRSSCWPTAP